MAGVSPPIFLMFAGPNGSGKSTITEAFRDRGLFPANYVNAEATPTRERLLSNDDNLY